MNLLKLGIGLFSALVLFSGCSSKNYFEPKDVVGEVEFDNEIPSEIVDMTRDGATLSNGQVITDSGISEIRIEDNFEFISSNEEYILAGDKCGNLGIYPKEVSKETNKKIDNISFSNRVVSASLKDKTLAVVTSDNSIILYNMDNKEVIFKQKLDVTYANDTRVATPKFLNKLVIFPTLDGKIVIVDMDEKKVARDIVVSSSKFLNNIIFLDILNDRLVVATPTRVLSISPTVVNSLDADVRDLLFVESGIYILTKDGTIILADQDLKIKKSKKYDFAHFVGLIYGNYLYAIEKEGYIIATDKELQSSNVFKIPSEIEKYIFATKDTIYYDNKYFKLGEIK